MAFLFNSIVKPILKTGSTLSRAIRSSPDARLKNRRPNFYSKVALGASVAALMVPMASYAIKYDEVPLRVNVRQIGHIDGTDKDGKFTYTNIYQIVIKKGDKESIGNFGLTGDLEKANYHVPIHWLSEESDISRNIHDLTDLNGVSDLLKDGKGLFELEMQGM
ncbi:hypothetical protein [Vibrio owensii]|uniref:hypothetical protein n=1 Tax=Vibrio harveyi group TaxID=717610 RepID=UPI003CC6937F